jgi:2-polyprenyl-6-methoxyphenol hydroxylase-like FAD-dependent oxidoreductase
LIAADGIHSVVRRQFYPDEGEPRFAGRMMWRGVTETEPVLSGRSMVWVGNDAQKFISYPISETLRQQGRARLNWVAAVQVPLDQTPPRSDWNREVDRALFSQRYANWRFPWLDVPDIIRRAPAVFEFPMVDRDPLPAWTRGRVTLLGDAAHPMWPIGSNGASQAILDTEALAQQLAPHVAQAPGLTQALPNALPAALPAALLAYEALRRPATAAVVLANRRGGPDQVLQLAEERAPDGFDDIEKVIPLTEREAIAARYKQTAGFDKSLVNQQAQSQQQQ